MDLATCLAEDQTLEYGLAVETAEDLLAGANPGGALEVQALLDTCGPEVRRAAACEGR